MSNIPHITFQQATALKRLGFNWYCLDSYIAGDLCRGIGWNNRWKTSDPIHKFPNHFKALPMIAAPNTAMFFRWIREEHHIYATLNHVLYDHTHLNFEGTISRTVNDKPSIYQHIMFTAKSDDPTPFDTSELILIDTIINILQDEKK